MIDTQMQRTTISLDKNLKKLAEKKAIEEGKTLQKVVNDALAQALFNPPVKRKKTACVKDFTHPIDKKMGALRREDFYNW